MKTYWPDVIHPSVNRSSFWWVWQPSRALRRRREPHTCALSEPGKHTWQTLGLSLGREVRTTFNLEQPFICEAIFGAFHQWIKNEDKRNLLYKLVFALLFHSLLHFKNVLYRGLTQPNICISKKLSLQRRQDSIVLKEIVLLSWNIPRKKKTWLRHS